MHKLEFNVQEKYREIAEKWNKLGVFEFDKVQLADILKSFYGNT